jgi:hypothetical protein
MAFPTNTAATGRCWKNPDCRPTRRVGDLFDRLDTPNFETVVRALEDASEVGATYGYDEEAARFLADARWFAKP